MQNLQLPKIEKKKEIAFESWIKELGHSIDINATNGNCFSMNAYH
jgi:hypothetical protein